MPPRALFSPMAPLKSCLVLPSRLPPPPPEQLKMGRWAPLSAGLLSWKWQNFSLCCFDDIVNKFKFYIMDLIHGEASKLRDFQLEGTLRTTGICYTQFQFSPKFAFCKPYPTPTKGKEKRNPAFPRSKVSGNGTSLIEPLVSSPAPVVGRPVLGAPAR